MTTNKIISIQTLLVANRGEIARRIFRTAREMGIRSVAVYADADVNSPFVSEADESVRLTNGYLDGREIIAAALSTGTQAIHPGYGFLSENSAFAADVEAAGLLWIGPSSDVISAMGDKIAAKRAAVEAGVPTLPSSEDPVDSARVGFPLLVKASAGGGGKGMRIVESPDSLPDAVAQARREALSGFGDDTVFLERYLAKSRHIEIQVLGDNHGNVIHLGERECSIQRRHQKIIEESPSPMVDAEMRSKMGEAALKLASAIGYQSAGTVEFLVDDSTREFWFLEVNTRLQVEHPVTEMVTGIDLVREQIRVATGETLGYDQDDITISGHAIEARLYAEDPSADFLPANGTLHAFEPPTDPAVRWDSGITRGSVVGVEFDPMLAKVIAHAASRSEAAARLALALERIHIGGVTTNRDYLAAALRSAEFLAGATTTDFVERVDIPGHRQIESREANRLCVAASMWLQAHHHANAVVLPNVRSGFVLGRVPPQRSVWRLGGEETATHYRQRRDRTFLIGAAADQGVATVHDWSPDHIDVEWQGRRCSYRATLSDDALYLTSGAGTAELGLVPRFVVPGVETPSGGLVAPMPGVVLEVRANPGDVVTDGQTLVVLEAMKMEHHMNAPSDGIVAEVRVAEGQQVDNGELLIVFESDLHEEN